MVLPFITKNYSSIIMAVPNDTPNSLIHSPCCLLNIPFLPSKNLKDTSVKDKKNGTNGISMVSK